MIPVIAATWYNYEQGSNLWPILLIFTAPLGTGFLIFILLISRLTAAKQGGTSSPTDAPIR